MKALQPIVRRSVWLGLGAATLLIAGCAGTYGIHRTSLTGAQEVPPVTTNAYGTTDIAVLPSKCPSAGSSSNCPTVYGIVTTSGMAGTAAHIHQGAAGQNGPVIVPLVKTGENAWAVPPGTTLTDAQYAAYGAGLLYVNVHSDANKGGEIRAQLKP
jgi:hypothetical protein